MCFERRLTFAWSVSVLAKLLKCIKKNTRTLFQFVYACLSNGYAAGFINGKIYKGGSKSLCLPGLNCYSCPGALGSCPIGSFQAVLSDKNYKFSFYVAGILIFFGSVFGRFICGWLCPFGLVQDLLFKLPFVKKLKKLPGDKYLKYLKYFIFLGFVVILPLCVLDIVGHGQPWFCKYICPSGTLFGGIPLIAKNPALQEVLGALFTWKSAILAFLVVLSVIVYRPFCRYICPLGAVYSLFNPISLYRYKVDENKCTKCGLCQKQCKMDIAVFKNANSPDCIRCGECLKACPHGALKTTFSKTKKEKE